MKKFVLMTVGFEMPTEEIMQKWMEWFGSIGDKIVEQVGLSNGREIAKDGSKKELAMDLEAITGYLVINAESVEEVEEIAGKCPAVSSTRVYEVRGN